MRDEMNLAWLGLAVVLPVIVSLVVALVFVVGHIPANPGAGTARTQERDSWSECRAPLMDSASRGATTLGGDLAW